MVPIASAVTILHGNGVLRETTAVLHMVRPRELHGKRKGRNDFVNQLRPKVRAKLQRKRGTKQVSALHLKNGEKSSEDNVELPYEFLKKANST